MSRYGIRVDSGNQYYYDVDINYPTPMTYSWFYMENMATILLKNLLNELVWWYGMADHSVVRGSILWDSVSEVSKWRRIRSFNKLIH